MYLTLLALFFTAVQCRESLNFDFGWKFILGDEPSWSPIGECNSTLYNINMTGLQCMGLQHAGTFASSAECCAAGTSEGAAVWQWCSAEAGCTFVPGDCWIGEMSDCEHPNIGWISFGTNSTPSPAPSPPPPPPTCPRDYPCNDFDDSPWRTVNVPHDFVVEGAPVSTADRNHGYLPFNISWYRKHFTVTASWQGQPVWLDFDGVYRASDYWLNGVWIGHWDSGYAPFRYYLHNVSGAVLNYGPDSPNILTVRVDALSHQEGWFYEGGGVYRHVTLNTAPLLNLVPWGIYAPSVITGPISSPLGLAGQQTTTSVYFPVYVDIQHSGAASGGGNVTFSLTSTLLNADGLSVGMFTARGSLPPSGWIRVQSEINFSPDTIINLWSPSSPYLYTLNVNLSSAAGEDVETVSVGVRSAIFDANAGLLMNGLPLQIQGFSQHQDFG